MDILSQRDPRWSSIKLGNSNLTIGSSGCLITCLSMIAGVTPDVFNKKLLAVKGFSGALVIWSKIQSAFPNLKFVWRSSSYNNDSVKSQINRNGFCLVECQPVLRGSSRHWVLFIGNKRLIDPWYGTNRPTSSYWFYTGFAAIDKI